MAQTDIPLASFSAQDALVAVMVGLSASDENMTTNELLAITRMVETLPVFAGFDRDRLHTISQTVFDLLTEEDGLDASIRRLRPEGPSGGSIERRLAIASILGASGSAKALPRLGRLEVQSRLGGGGMGVG